MAATATPALAPADVPIDLTGEQARRLAERELADPAYRQAEPGLLQQAIAWLVEQVERIVAEAGAAAPGGWLGILGLVAAVILAVLFARWRLGPVRGAAEVTFAVDPSVPASAYRARAHTLAAAGDWDAALRTRMRAIVRGGQERGLIDAQPGWTADEVARALGARLPPAAPALAGAAQTFDEVAYGGRPASEAAYRVVAAADDAAALVQPVGQP
jgi:hypothetical protein